MFVRPEIRVGNVLCQGHQIPEITLSFCINNTSETIAKNRAPTSSQSLRLFWLAWSLLDYLLTKVINWPSSRNRPPFCNHLCCRVRSHYLGTQGWIRHLDQCSSFCHRPVCLLGRAVRQPVVVRDYGDKFMYILKSVMNDVTLPWVWRGQFHLGVQGKCGDIRCPRWWGSSNSTASWRSLCRSPLTWKTSEGPWPQDLGLGGHLSAGHRTCLSWQQVFPLSCCDKRIQWRQTVRL